MKNNAAVALRYLCDVLGAIQSLSAAAEVVNADTKEQVSKSPPFCNCGCCSQRSICKVERRCCRQTAGQCVLQSNDVVDIFRDIVVRTAVSADRNTLCENRWEFTNNVLRHQAYKQFVFLVGGNTGMKKRLIIPSCVTWHIRDRWPSEDGAYTGFKPATGAQAAVLTWAQEGGIFKLGGSTEVPGEAEESSD